MQSVPNPSHARHSARVAAILFLLCGGRANASSDMRLGQAVVPTFESLQLVVDADSTNYSGTAHLDLDMKEPVTAFRLHAKDMTLGKIELRPAGKAKGSPIAVTTEPGEIGLVTLRTKKTLERGRYTLDIEFTNEFSTKAVGLYRMKQDGRGYLFTQFESDDAREAFPCFDEPGFKIPWQMTLVVPEKHLALFNTPIEKETAKDGWKTLVFAKTPPLPSYLLAIASGPFETVDIPGLGVPGRIVTVAGQSQLADLAAQMTPPLLKGLEHWFGQKYPFAKLDLLAVPEYWYGAMENPGAITFSANILLVDPKAASASQRRTLARITAHELAHMWFGDLVTMAWWDDLWLNESFADWMGDKITQEVFPEYRVDLSELSDTQGTMAGDARPSAIAIQHAVDPTDNMLENVGTQYNKGKTVLGMFEQWVGPENFRKGVLDYMQAHAWGNATAADLWTALGKVSGQDVPGAMATFLEQPGIPLVTAEPLPNGHLRLGQRRLLNAGVSAPAQLWKIPVSLRYSDGKTIRNTTVLLSTASQEVDLQVPGTPAWIYPDADARGYYRWSLPSDQIAAVTASPSTTLNPRERVGCLGNMAALLDAGVLHGDEYLAALSRFSNDPEPDVIETLANGVNKVRVAFVTDDLADAFAVYVRRTLGPALERYGLEPKPGENETVTLVRPTLLDAVGDHGQDAKVRARAKELASAYLENPKAVDPSIAGTVLRLAAHDGDRALYDAYRARFEAAKVPAERTRYMAGLGSFRDPALVEATLQYALTGPLRPQEITRLPMAMADSPRGRDRLFRWMTENYDTITGRIPKEFQGFLPFYAGGCEPERVAAAQAFFGQPAHDSPGTRTSLARVTDSVTDCAHLREREGAAVTTYLTQLVGNR